MCGLHLCRERFQDGTALRLIIEPQEEDGEEFAGMGLHDVGLERLEHGEVVAGGGFPRDRLVEGDGHADLLVRRTRCPGSACDRSVSPVRLRIRLRNYRPVGGWCYPRRVIDGRSADCSKIRRGLHQIGGRSPRAVTCPDRRRASSETVRRVIVFDSAGFTGRISSPKPSSCPIERVTRSRCAGRAPRRAPAASRSRRPSGSARSRHSRPRGGSPATTGSSPGCR